MLEWEESVGDGGAVLDIVLVLDDLWGWYTRAGHAKGLLDLFCWRM